MGKEVAECLMVLLATEASQHLATLQQKKAALSSDPPVPEECSGGGGGGGGGGAAAATASDDALIRRQEAMGMRIGAALMERLMREQPLLRLQPWHDPKEAVKIVVRDLWPVAFRRHSVVLQMSKSGGVFRVKDDTFKYIQHVSTAGAKGELYAPGTRGLLTRQIAHDEMTFPEGSKVVLVRQLPGNTQNAAAFEASIEGNTVTVTTADFSTDTPMRVSPLSLLYLPAGIIRGALYSVGVSAWVEPRVSEGGAPGAEFTVYAKPANTR